MKHMIEEKNVLIRKANITDFKRIVILLKQLYTEGKLDKRKLIQILGRSHKKSNYISFVAISKGRVIGFASALIINTIYKSLTYCYLSELIVDRLSRRSGIGSRLVGEIEKVAKRKLCNHIGLTTEDYRKPAHGFYKSKGYHLCGYAYKKKLRK